MVDIHAIKDYAFDVIICCSVAHNFLPPFEFLNDFPTAQKYYKLLIYVIGYIALNARSTVYKSISTKDGTQQSAASQSPGSQADGQNKPDGNGG